MSKEIRFIHEFERDAVAYIEERGSAVSEAVERARKDARGFKSDRHLRTVVGQYCLDGLNPPAPGALRHAAGDRLSILMQAYPDGVVRLDTPITG